MNDETRCEKCGDFTRNGTSICGACRGLDRSPMQTTRVCPTCGGEIGSASHLTTIRSGHGDIAEIG